MDYNSGEEIGNGKFVLYRGLIKPNIVMKNKEPYEITYLSKEFYIHGLIVILSENKLVEDVLLLGFHPNQNEGFSYCLPKEKLFKKFTEIYFNVLLRSIKTYYLDSAHFVPTWKYLQYGSEPLSHATIGIKM